MSQTIRNTHRFTCSWLAKWVTNRVMWRVGMGIMALASRGSCSSTDSWTSHTPELICRRTKKHLSHQQELKWDTFPLSTATGYGISLQQLPRRRWDSSFSTFDTDFQHGPYTPHEIQSRKVSTTIRFPYLRISDRDGDKVIWSQAFSLFLLLVSILLTVYSTPTVTSLPLSLFLAWLRVGDYKWWLSNE